MLHGVQPQPNGLGNGLVVGEVSRDALGVVVGHFDAGPDLRLCHLDVHGALVGALQAAGVHQLDLVHPLGQLAPQGTDELIRSGALHIAGGVVAVAGVGAESGAAGDDPGPTEHALIDGVADGDL